MKKFLVVMAFLVPFGTMAVVLRSMVVEPDRPSQLSSIPLTIGEWEGRELSIGQATASSLQATETLLRNYEHPDGTRIGFFIAYFRDQKYGSQIHSPRHCLPGGGWGVTNLQRVFFDIGAEKISVNRMTISKRSLVDQMFYWYQSRSGVLTSEYSLKFDLLKNSLMLRPTDAALIRLTISQGRNSIEDCQARVEQFIQACIMDIQKAMPFET